TATMRLPWTTSVPFSMAGPAIGMILAPVNARVCPWASTVRTAASMTPAATNQLFIGYLSTAGVRARRHHCSIARSSGRASTPTCGAELQLRESCPQTRAGVDVASPERGRHSHDSAHPFDCRRAGGVGDAGSAVGDGAPGDADPGEGRP